MKVQQKNRDTYLQVELTSRTKGILRKVDIFSFVPFPKTTKVSTVPSISASLLFLLIVVAYFIFKFWTFLADNPPKITVYETKLDDEIYTLPKFAIAFMDGNQLNQTNLYDSFFNYSLTKQRKTNEQKLNTTVDLHINNHQYLYWLDDNIKDFYSILRSPSQELFAKGFLYSSNETNFTKVLVSMCDVNGVNSTCESVENISKLSAGGRIFLFIEDMEDNSTLGYLEGSKAVKYQIYNFFLIPFLYKRIIIEFDVVKTEVNVDYFYRFSPQQTTRLQIRSVYEQASNTSINAIDDDRIPLQLLGISMQLSGKVVNVKASYQTILEMLTAWWQFANLMLAIFTLVVLAYNAKKFYTKYPKWKKFEEGLSKKNVQVEQ